MNDLAFTGRMATLNSRLRWRAYGNVSADALARIIADVGADGRAYAIRLGAASERGGDECSRDADSEWSRKINAEYIRRQYVSAISWFAMGAHAEGAARVMPKLLAVSDEKREVGAVAMIDAIAIYNQARDSVVAQVAADLPEADYALR